MKSGYVVKIEAFIEADPMDFDKMEGVLKDLRALNEGPAAKALKQAKFDDVRVRSVQTVTRKPKAFLVEATVADTDAGETPA